MSDKNKERLTCLMDEWKSNVSLYIDQDKRGFDRIKMFLLIHAGLLIFYGKLLGLYITSITWRMSKRAHFFILLRKIQGMLIEKKVKEILGGSDCSWETNSGVVTTFTREHVAFIHDFDEQWAPLKEEMKSLGEYVSRPFIEDDKSALGHLAWLERMYQLICTLWVGLCIASIYVVSTLHFGW